MSSNFLDNGAVLPNGLLSENTQAMMEGFNKSYKNVSLRVGVIVASYPTTNEGNRFKLTNEYDVMVIEQNEDKGATTILYRNCMSSEGLGSIADFFERSLRPKKKKMGKGDAVNLKGQDGAVVLVLCLDGMSDKGIIVGQLTHPDRKTTLKTSEPRLEGEYNGVNIKIESDGSCKFTFKGPTDSEGKPTTKNGDTTAKIEADGSFQLDHKTIKLRLDKTGEVTLNADANINVTTKKNATITCVDSTIKSSGKTLVDTTGNVDVKSGADASVTAAGKINAKAGGDANVTAGGKVVIKAPMTELNGSASGITTEGSHQGVIDFITGVPVMASKTVKSDV